MAKGRDEPAFVGDLVNTELLFLAVLCEHSIVK